MTGKTHNYTVAVEWTGNRGEGTATYRAYSRDFTVNAGEKPEIPGSSDPPAAESICISVDGAVVAKVKANSLDVEELTGAQLAPCR